MPSHYTGVGSRDTPPEICDLMKRVASWLSGQGLILRSGAAKGADTAFENGAGELKEIYLPWIGFNNHPSRLTPTPEAFALAEKFHPAWHKCKRGARLMHARNCHQVLGHDLNTPSAFVICWTNYGYGEGGTGQAIRIAKANNIIVHDLGNPELLSAYRKRFNTENRHEANREAHPY
jgi:hypothetical protein